VQRLYQVQIADTDIAPHSRLRLASAGKRRPRPRLRRWNQRVEDFM